MSYFDHMSPCCDLDLENDKPIFLHDILAYDDARQHQNWYKKKKKKKREKFGGLKGIIWTNTDMLTFTVTLTLNAIIQYFHKTLWLMMKYHNIMFGCQGINSSEDIVESHILII